MHSEPLIGIFAKVERAKSHIVDLTERFKAYIASEPYEVASEINSDPTEEVWRFKVVRKMPPDFSAIAGDAFYNLRSSLDNLASAIAIKNGKTISGVSFPFGETLKKFDEALADKAKKLPESARDMIKVLKPYKGGNDLLWLLHRANLSDKHAFPLETVLANSLFVTEVIFFQGSGLICGPRDGQHMTIAGYVPTRRWSGQKHDLEFLTVVPGSRFRTDFQPAFDIALKNVSGFEAEPVIAVLNQASQAVERILIDFEKAFFL
jgi:hypothetical protein